MDGSRGRSAPRRTDRSSGVRSVHSRVRRSGDDSGLPLAGRSSGVRSVDYYYYGPSFRKPIVSRSRSSLYYLLCYFVFDYSGEG